VVSYTFTCCSRPVDLPGDACYVAYFSLCKRRSSRRTSQLCNVDHSVADSEFAVGCFPSAFQSDRGDVLRAALMMSLGPSFRW
jgi:hypothetical protein